MEWWHKYCHELRHQLLGWSDVQIYVCVCVAHWYTGQYSGTVTLYEWSSFHKQRVYQSNHRTDGWRPTWWHLSPLNKQPTEQGCLYTCSDIRLLSHSQYLLCHDNNILQGNYTQMIMWETADNKMD